MKEHEIRPQQLFKEYIRLVETDANIYTSRAKSVPCPGCGNSKTQFLFEKQGFAFDSCPKCNTFFCNPRPSVEELEIFYGNTPSASFWNDVFWPAVEERRRNEIFAPRARKIREFCQSKGIFVKKVLDIGAGNGIFLEEFRKLDKDAEYCAIDPGKKAVEKCMEKGFKVFQSTIEQADQCHGWADLAVSFEVLEHVFDPLEFVTSVKKCLAPGGVALMTTLNQEGFDLRLLKEKSTQILPPLHMNFFSLAGFRNLFTQAGFSAVEIDTPGRLDVDIISKALKNKVLSTKDVGPFLDWLMNKADVSIKNDFQQFLADSCMSSHIWIWGKK